MKIAVASKDGISINLHFGHTRMFWIYENTLGKFTLVEKREVDNYCHGNTGSSSAMVGILEAIKDCDTVFSAKIGDGPISRLKNIGVESNTEYAYESIDEMLASYLNDAFI